LEPSKGDGLIFVAKIATECLLTQLNTQGFFSFAINPEISVKEIMLVEDLDSIFVLPLSLPAFEEVLDLQSFLRLVDYDRIQMMVFHIG